MPNIVLPRDSTADCSRRGLTVSNDKDLAGVWADYLPEDLFWRVYSRQERIIRGLSINFDVPVKGEVLRAWHRISLPLSPGVSEARHLWT